MHILELDLKSFLNAEIGMGRFWKTSNVDATRVYRGDVNKSWNDNYEQNHINVAKIVHMELRNLAI